MNELQQAYPNVYGQSSQFGPQGFFGGLAGSALGGALGRGIGGLFGHSGLGGQIGQAAGGIGGAFLPLGLDPLSAAYAQQIQQQQLQQQQLQSQLSPQGWFGNILSQVGQPLGGAIGGIFGQSGLGSAIGGAAGQLGRVLPFGADPISALYAQQQQQQQLQQLQHAQLAQQLGQQGQLAPQGWFGNVLSQIGQPLGGAIGGIFGQSGIGNAIGGAASQLGRILPFGADPVSQLMAQQAQQQQQQFAQQLAPQGWIGNLIGQVGQPLASHLATTLGHPGLSNILGGAASMLGRVLPFGADPVSAMYAQQAQQQQLAQQLAQQQAQMAQMAQMAQQGNSYYPAFQGGQGVGAQGGVYGGQQTLH